MDRNILYFGASQAPSAGTLLQAGPLSVSYAAGDIRYIKLGEHEILRRVYAAVRDHNWETIAPQISNEQVETQSDSFQVIFNVEHLQNDINFVWQGRITGTADGTITFSFDGEARSTFRRNRIGFCVLHPTNCAGLDCTVQHVDGSLTGGQFPQHISPHQPFFAMRSITHEVMPGVRAEVLMEGDTFEMEDQRNWTDASYKTYCTPLDLPFPVMVESGTKISQTITVKLHGTIPEISTEAAPLTLTISDQTVPLPAIGLGSASHHKPLAKRKIRNRFQALRLTHLRVDLWLEHASYTGLLEQATREAQAIGVKLEIAVFVSDNAAEELKVLRGIIDDLQPPLAHWLIFHTDEKTTSAQWVQLAREHLGDLGAPIGAGTDYFFTELNRERPPIDDVDFVTYSLNPQVHAFANLDLVETLAAQATTVDSAQQFSNGKPITISPVTLKMRRNPNATGPEPRVAAGDLPPRVDPRPMSLFGAGWTLGSIKYLAESGVQSVTYYETTGWYGVMDSADGSQHPRFPVNVGNVYPLYQVLAAVGAFAGGTVVVSQSSAPLLFESLVLRKGDNTRMLLANLTGEPQTIRIPATQGTVKVLDETNAAAAMREPEVFLAAPGTAFSGDQIKLLPYAVAWIDT